MFPILSASPVAACPRLLAAAALLALAAPAALDAGTIVVNDSTWGWLNESGTENDPVTYVVGPTGPVTVSANVSATWLGGSHTRLLVQNGSTYNSGGYVYIGQTAGQNDNQARVTGNSAWNIASELYVGYSGSRNALIVDGGSRVTVRDYDLRVGRDVTSTHNQITVSGPGSSLETGGRFVIGSFGSSHNSVRIENGATVSAGYFSHVGGSSADHNTLVITGAGSRFTSTNAFFIGVDAGHNLLTIEDGGMLVVLDGSLGIGQDAGNYLNVNGGVLALAGNQLWSLNSLIDSGLLRFWDGSGWITGGRDDFDYGFFANEADALGFSGYEGLGNYTLLTTAFSPVPEPAAFAVFASLAVMGAAALRRRRSRGASAARPRA